MCNLESFHPKLIICDHFDDLINRIDIKTEHFLEAFCISKRINDLREEHINILEKIKLKNLLLIENINNEHFLRKWNELIDNKEIQHKVKCDSIKIDLINIDCLLMEDDYYESGNSIWITSHYYAKKSLEFLE